MRPLFQECLACGLYQGLPIIGIELLFLTLLSILHGFKVDLLGSKSNFFEIKPFDSLYYSLTYVEDLGSVDLRKEN